MRRLHKTRKGKMTSVLSWRTCGYPGRIKTSDPHQQQRFLHRFFALVGSNPSLLVDASLKCPVPDQAYLSTSASRCFLSELTRPLLHLLATYHLVTLDRHPECHQT